MKMCIFYPTAAQQLSIMSRSESRRRQHSSGTRTKFDVELPNINKTTLMIRDKGKQNNFMHSSILVSFTDKVGWVIEPVDYDFLNEHQIDQEYNRLRKELHSLNADVAKALEKMELKSLKKSKVTEPDPIHILEVRDREIENNTALLDRLRKEYQQLQKRVASVASHNKDTMEEDIKQARSKITKMKEKIKELNMRNKHIGNEIVNTDQVYEQIRRLEKEKEVAERKKLKLEDKTEKVYESIANSELKLEQINDDYTIAQNYFEEYHGKTQQKEEMKQLESKLRYSKHCYEVTHKKNEISQNTKQQKYHISLKNLQMQMKRVSDIDNKTRDTEMEIINCKKMIGELEATFKRNQLMKEKELLENQRQPVFFTEYEDVGPANDHNHISVKKEQIQQVSDTRVDEQKQERQLSEKDIATKMGSLVVEEKLDTSYGGDAEEEQDVILELDEKFLSAKGLVNRSRLNDKETELGDEMPEDLVIDDNDSQMMEFESRISEERKNSKKMNKGQFDVSKELSEVSNQLKKLQFGMGETLKQSDSDI